MDKKRLPEINDKMLGHLAKGEIHPAMKSMVQSVAQELLVRRDQQKTSINEAFKNHGKAYRPGWAFTIAVQDNRFYKMPDHTMLYLLPDDVFASDWIRVTDE